MLWRCLQAHGGELPADVHVCFANTGKEREETLRFVYECAVQWNVRVRWLEWRQRTGDHAERFEEVGFNSASRCGEPFAKLIEAKSYLPNSVMRFCTDELKIKVMRDFMRSQGYDHWQNVVGLRHDEKHSVNKARARSALGKERWTTALPLDDARISNRMVRAFWALQCFDLQLLPFEGNCDACFLKARPKLYEIERTAPGTLQWWADQEVKAKATFTTEYGYAELIESVRRQPDLFAGGLFDNDPEQDAECGLWCAGAQQIDHDARTAA